MLHATSFHKCLNASVFATQSPSRSSLPRERRFCRPYGYRNRQLPSAANSARFFHGGCKAFSAQQFACLFHISVCFLQGAFCSPSCLLPERFHAMSLHHLPETIYFSTSILIFFFDYCGFPLTSGESPGRSLPQSLRQRPLPLPLP